MANVELMHSFTAGSSLTFIRISFRRENKFPQKYELINFVVPRIFFRRCRRKIIWEFRSNSHFCDLSHSHTGRKKILYQKKKL
jgi:hypothetical protein